MYRQFDGYPSGHGVELGEFLNSIVEVTNGIRPGDKRKTANGMGCLAAQMIAHFKVGVGNIYIESTNTNLLGHDFEYHVYETYVIVKNYSGHTMFKGTWKDFYEFCRTDES
jgi:hypothetical protein